MPKKLEIFSLKYIKVLEFLKTSKTFLNDGTKHKIKLYGSSKHKK